MLFDAWTNKDTDQHVYMCRLINFMAILFLDSILLEAAHTCSYIVRVARMQHAQNRKRPRDGTSTDRIVEQQISDETRPTQASLLVNTK